MILTEKTEKTSIKRLMFMYKTYARATPKFKPIPDIFS